jgi:hypothetical protein
MEESRVVLLAISQSHAAQTHEIDFEARRANGAGWDD